MGIINQQILKTSQQIYDLKNCSKRKIFLTIIGRESQLPAYNTSIYTAPTIIAYCSPFVVDTHFHSAFYTAISSHEPDCPKAALCSKREHCWEAKNVSDCICLVCTVYHLCNIKCVNFTTKDNDLIT